MLNNCRISELASAPEDTHDAAILSNLVWRYGEDLQQLSREQKLALRAVLSYYLFYKLKCASDHVILTLEGIKSNGAEGLSKLLTEQRSKATELLGKAAVVTHQNYQERSNGHAST